MNFRLVDGNSNKFVKIIWPFGDDKKWKYFIVNVIYFVSPLNTESIFQLNLLQDFALPVNYLTYGTFCTYDKNLVVDFCRANDKRFYFQLAYYCKALETFLSFFIRDNFIILNIHFAILYEEYPIVNFLLIFILFVQFGSLISSDLFPCMTVGDFDNHLFCHYINQ